MAWEENFWNLDNVVLKGISCQRIESIFHFAERENQKVSDVVACCAREWKQDRFTLNQCHSRSNFMFVGNVVGVFSRRGEGRNDFFSEICPEDNFFHFMTWRVRRRTAHCKHFHFSCLFTWVFIAPFIIQCQRVLFSVELDVGVARCREHMEAFFAAIMNHFSRHINFCLSSAARQDGKWWNFAVWTRINDAGLILNQERFGSRGWQTTF